MPTQRLPVSTPENIAQADQIVRLARQALQRGDTRQARSYAAQATRLAPELEDGWLLLAAVASPRASVAYLQKALEINPASQRARSGMHWALGRMRTLESAKPPEIRPPIQPQAGEAPLRVPAPPAARRRTSPWAYVSLALALLLLCMAGGFLTFAWWPVASPALAQAQDYAVALVYSPTPGPSETPLPTQTPLPSPTASPSATPVPTDTPLPTETPTPLPTATETPLPTPTHTATFTAAPTLPPPTPEVQPTKRNKGKKNPNPGVRPGAADASERWIDVDLSAQTVFAMQGDQVVNQFLVSTGRWPTLTVTGVFRVYVKYRAADMSGADYYLPDVPYVMYFYKGYGLHGTYWHNNFGTPMSHGCVNLRPTDAGWLFDWASVGTIVNVHE
jgi:lipoprotein-anchoring transpeptidase ErfK/SrfK